MEEKQLKTLPLVLQKATYKCIIPAKVEKMIRTLCSQISTVEWSGVLFFTYEGSFETNDLTITCQDICLMDIGNSSYTEFIESPDIINYQIEHDLLDCKTALIHSHNNMPTFFSGTDLSTLQDEGASMNNFVSLIVNNEGTYKAAITRQVTIERTGTEKCYYKYFGEESEISTSNVPYSTISKEIQYFYLDIIKEEVEEDELYSRIKELKSQNSYANTISMGKSSGMNSLFTQDYYKNYSTPEINKFDDNITPIKISSEVIEVAALQILTGSILITNKSKLGINDLIGRLDTTLKHRFPKDEDFEYWIEGQIEGILNTTYDNGVSFSDNLDLLAYEIKNYLSQYANKSLYVKKICDLLDNYIE